MQILGDLIHLDKTRSMNWLPLPWWHRAPLGLANNTTVFVSLVGRAGSDRPGELIVSVLDPERQSQTFLLECSKPDRPGILSEILKILSKHNIALAESVTLCDHLSDRGGSHKHSVTLVCENQGPGNVKDAMSSATQALQELQWEVRQKEMFLPMQLQWHSVGIVEHGWIKNVKWNEELLKRYGNLEQEFDFERMVVSADTDRRYLRCVFPRKHARVVTVHHADKPSALEHLTAELTKANFNLLSALLRRGGAKPHSAVLVAVCEPCTRGGTIDTEAVTSALEGMDQKFRVSEVSVSDGMPAEQSLYPRHPEDYVIHIPEEIASSVRGYRDQLRKLHPKKVKGRKTHFVFLSRRFQPGIPEEYANKIKETLQKRGLVPLEGKGRIAVQKSSYGQIVDKLWNCDAGIVLFAIPRDAERSREECLSASIVPNLAHELGFLHGHGKPVLILLEDGVRPQLGRFSNIQGLAAPSFPGVKHANDTSVEELQRSLACIEKIVSEWIDECQETGALPTTLGQDPLDGRQGTDAGKRRRSRKSPSTQ